MFVKSGREETTYLEGEKIPSIRYHILKGSGFVKDGFSTRRGGVSKGQFSSMNFSVKMKKTYRKTSEFFWRSMDLRIRLWQIRYMEKRFDW